MSCRDLILSLGMLLLIFTPSSEASEISPPGEEVIKFGVAVEGSEVVEKIQVPDNATAIEVRLKIANPEQLDLDLFLYDSDPTSAYLSPLCVSDSIRGDESCAIKRPDSGSVWAQVISVGGSGKSTFTLTKSFVDSSRAELVLAGHLSPNGLGVPVGPEKMSFQFQLQLGDLAAIVLEGEGRDLRVEDEEGNVFSARKTGPARQQITIGEKFRRPGEKPQEVEWLLQGVTAPKRYIVKVGPSGNPYGQANAILSLAVPKTESVHYAIVFSTESLDDEVNTIRGPERNLTRPGTISPLLFKFLPSSPLMVAEVHPTEAYDIAVCDELGFVLSIATDKVLWNPSREGAYRARRGSEEVYFAVFPSPFLAPTAQELPKLTLLTKLPKEGE